MGRPVNTRRAAEIGRPLGRAEALAREEIDGAAEIDVDQICPTRLHELGGPAHLVGIVARQLHAEERFGRRAPDQCELSATALLQATGEGHLAHRDSGA